MLVHWIWLAVRPEITDQVKYNLIQHFHDPEDIYYARPESLRHVEGITAEGILSLQNKNLEPAEEILRICENKGIRLLTVGDACYPNRLKNIPDPPVVLYYKGYMPDVDESPAIAVVGTRKASAYGLGISKRMGAEIASCGGIVVSGLAYGIDGMAMTGALSAEGTVIGVLGCGADVIYPASNRSLFDDTQTHGCLLTEFPPGTPPRGWNFPKRNRIISGLSCGVLVVEAPEKSGALITARQAADQGRDVFVIPGNIDVLTCAGSNALLRDGAVAVSSGWDVISEYQDIFPGKVHQSRNRSHLKIYPDELLRASKESQNQARVAQKRMCPKKEREEPTTEIDIDKAEKSPYSVLNKKQMPLTAEEKAIVDVIKDEICLVDDIIDRCGLETGKVLACLTLLEVKGVIKRLPGRRIGITGK